MVGHIWGELNSWGQFGEYIRFHTRSLAVRTRPGSKMRLEVQRGFWSHSEMKPKPWTQTRTQAYTLIRRGVIVNWKLNITIYRLHWLVPSNRRRDDEPVHSFVANDMVCKANGDSGTIQPFCEKIVQAMRLLCSSAKKFCSFYHANWTKSTVLGSFSCWPMILNKLNELFLLPLWPFRMRILLSCFFSFYPAFWLIFFIGHVKVIVSGIQSQEKNLKIISQSGWVGPGTVHGLGKT